MNQENKIVGIGYNGMPNGCDDDVLPWARTADNQLDTKYPYGEITCTHTEYRLSHSTHDNNTTVVFLNFCFTYTVYTLK